jgi:glutathione S-transferase
MITLYFAPRSRSFAALWLLEELGLAYELKRLDLDNEEQKSPDILRLNAFGKVPIITDGQMTISERGAICSYLADRYGLGKLAPRLDDPLRGEYLRWMYFAVGVMEPLFLAKFMHLEVPPAQAPWGTFETANAVMDQAVAKGPYLLGEQFSAADVLMGTMIRWGLMWELVAGEHLAGYVQRLEAREAFKRTQAIEAG